MAKAEASVEELVGMIERGELRLPEMQRQYVWQATRVRDRMDSPYCGDPSGAILVWETDEAVPLREWSIEQELGPHGRLPANCPNGKITSMRSTRETGFKNG